MNVARMMILLLTAALLLSWAAAETVARPDGDRGNGPPDHAQGKGHGDQDAADGGDDGPSSSSKPADDGPPGNGHSNRADDDVPRDEGGADAGADAGTDAGTDAGADADPEGAPDTASPASPGHDDDPSDPPHPSDPSASPPVPKPFDLDRGGPQPPIALFIVETLGPYVLVDAIDAFDPDGTIARYHWDWGDGTAEWGSDLEFHHYDDPLAVRAITLRVIDHDGLDDTMAIRLDAAGDPITAQMDLHGDGDMVIADGHGSDAGTFLIASWFWEWGDGTMTDGPIAEHRYTTDGTYTIRLTVTDEIGRSATTEGTAHVTSQGTTTMPRIAAHVAASQAQTSDTENEVASSPDGALLLAFVAIAASMARRR